MFKNLIHFALFLAIVMYFLSCSSSNGVKYNLLSKNDRENIDSFCICTAPYILYWNKSQNLKDSAEAIKYMDSLGFMLNKFTACTEILKNLHIDKKNEKEYNAEMLEYIKDKHPECYDFLIEKEKKDK